MEGTGMISLPEQKRIVRAYLREPVAAERWFSYYSGTEPRSPEVVRESLREAVARCLMS